MSQLKLEQLFHKCDRKGSGFIDLDEFRDLCSGFGISTEDADMIFADLDHDGDGRISFEDFSFGFRDFLTPGQTSRPPGTPHRQSFRTPNELHSIQQAWTQLAENLSQEDIRNFLSASGDKIFTLYEELQTSDVPQHVMDHFQDLVSALVTDVKKIEQKNKLLEERYQKERESHSAHLKNIEAELEGQMAKIEQQALKKAKQEHDQDKRLLQQKMNAELTELQTQLRLFQKVDTWLNKEKDGHSHSEETQKRLDHAVEENRNLKLSLNDTQTNIALLRAELGQIRSQYENKCTELSEERKDRIEYMYESENIHRQLELLRSANQKLQDTNDGLVQIVDVNTLRSPRPSKRNSRRGSQSGESVDSFSSRNGSTRGSNRLRVSDRPTPYGLKRLLDDLDSGSSSLPGEEEFKFQEDEHCLQEPKSIGQRDRDLTEVDNRIVVSDHKYQDKPQGFSVNSKPTPKPRNPNLICSNYDDDEREQRIKPEFELQKGPRPMSRQTSLISELRISTRDLEATGPPDRTYKVVFAGDAAVGKTSFINRITKGVFLNNLSSTLGVDFQVKMLRVDERNIALQLWDTAGQERFRSVTRSYFRRADGVMLLYDVTNERSFLSVRQWIDAVDDVSEKRIPIMLCGNKLDLRSDLIDQGCRCVTSENGEKLAREHSATFLETSSKDGDNVLDALVQLSRDMCASEDAEVQTSILKIREDDPPKKRGCCK